MRISRVWFMRLPDWRVRFIRSEAPCWKGEIQVGCLLIGWQAGKEPK